MPTFEIAFAGTDEAENNILAQDLEHHLSQIIEGGEITRKKSGASSQDFGSTLVLVLGTPVAIIAAKALAEFLKRRTGARIRITKDGTLIAENLDSRDAAKIAEAFTKAS